MLELLAEGHTNRRIGEELFLAEKTVKNYVSNLLSKMGMSRRTEAAVYAARLQRDDAAPRREFQQHCGRPQGGRLQGAAETVDTAVTTPAGPWLVETAPEATR